LARTGFDAQQTDQPVNGERPDNLFEPVPGDHGAHGEFDNQAAKSSIELWVARHRRALLGAGIVAGARRLAARGWPLPADRRLRADRRLPLGGARVALGVDRLVLHAALRLGQRARTAAGLGQWRLLLDRAG